MRCAAGERALFTADADCGTARQQGSEDDQILLGLVGCLNDGRKALQTTVLLQGRYGYQIPGDSCVE